MFKKIKIKNAQRGLLFEDNNFIKLLNPGVNKLPLFKETVARLIPTNEIFTIPVYNLDNFLESEELTDVLTTLDVKKSEIVLHYIDGILKNIYREGKYFLFAEIKKHEFIFLNKKETELDMAIMSEEDFDFFLDYKDFYKEVELLTVKDYELVLHYENDVFKKIYRSGDYAFFTEDKNHEFKFIDKRVSELNLKLIDEYDLEHLLNDEEIAKELSILTVKDYEIALYYENNIFKNIYKTGIHAFFIKNKIHEFKLIDKRKPEIDKDFDISILNNPLLYNTFNLISVYEYEAGLLYFDNKFQKVLSEGLYYFWNGVVNSSATKVDLRQQQIEISGQELMTLDKITLRLNFITQYKIVDAKKVTTSISDYEQQIYILLQLILREYIGSLTLDEILQNKQEIGEYVLAKIKEKEREFGIEFIFSGLKDVILPGEIKDILNTVLIAEKKSQANMIMRREETASTRSLLNTAKLLDGNKTLHRLKEMEYVEKIFDKINSVSLSSNSNVLEQIQTLLLKDLGDK